MRILGSKRIRRRHFRKAVWIVISTLAALGMVLVTVAPALSNLTSGAPAEMPAGGSPTQAY
jgi:hypothetical protein